MPAWVSANSVRCQKKGSAIIRNPQRTAKSLMDIENEILDIYLGAHSGLLLRVAVWLELSARIGWRSFDAKRSTYLRCLFPSFSFSMPICLSTTFPLLLPIPVHLEHQKSSQQSEGALGQAPCFEVWAPVSGPRLCCLAWTCANYIHSVFRLGPWP